MIIYKKKLMNLLKKIHLEHKKGFTLVELIVVITILWVLWTISFISLWWYALDSRNSKRLSDMRSMEKSLEYYLSRYNKLPDNTSLWSITLSWDIVARQWYYDNTLWDNLWVYWDYFDPLDDSKYILSYFDKSYQLLWFLENDWKRNSNLERVPISYGTDLWILLTQNNQSLVDSWSLEINTISGSVPLFLDNNFYSFNDNGLEVHFVERVNSYSSCKAIYNDDITRESWVYNLDINNDWVFEEVYCDMNDWWWTALFSVYWQSTTWVSNSTQWTNPTVNINDYLSIETTYKSYELLKNNKLKICRWDLDSCYVMEHNTWNKLIDFFVNTLRYTDYSVFNYNESLAPTHSYNLNWPSNIWSDRTSEYFWNLWVWGIPDNVRYNKYGVGINIYSNNRIWFQADNNNWWSSFDNEWLGIWVYRSWNCRDFPRLSVSLNTTCEWDDNMWYVLAQ